MQPRAFGARARDTRFRRYGINNGGVKRNLGQNRWLVATLCSTLAWAETDPEALLASSRALRGSGDLDGAANVLIEATASITPAGGRVSPEIFRHLGEIRLEQGRAGDALRRFRQALEAAPDLPVLHYQAGLAGRLAGDEAVAATHLATAVQLGFGSAAARMHLAAAYLASGNLSAGLHAARAFLRMGPQSPWALLQVGRPLFEQFFYEDALVAFRAALASDPTMYEARLLAALSCNALGRHREAVELLERPDTGDLSAEAAALLASAKAAAGSGEDADTLFREAIRAAPSSPHAYLNWAFSLLDRDRVGEAERRLGELASLPRGPTPKVFYQVRRNSCAEIGGALGSGAMRRPGPGLSPAAGDAYFGLARTLAGRDHHSTAVEALRLAMRHEGASQRSLLAVARSCLHLDPDGPAAVAILGRLAEEPAVEPETLHLLGRAHLRQGRTELAIRAHRAAVSLAPSNPSFHTQLGRALAESPEHGATQAALRSLRTAARLDPGALDARYEIGKLLLAIGQPEDAIEPLEEVVRREPEFYNAYYVLGQAYLRTGRSERARACLSEFESKREAVKARAGSGSGFAPG